ncbi:hypothetical protein DM01DRAFT_1342734 [Hesseltinella vesiculosa]|uniref:Myb-like domain-containing protein n=1 Tax=Hesseltinella vesiculosa TaxID=101127 RepID=A0A1X2GUV4_9FUNG|nr:hypothetical protein DM01DRAFT_1342734 [Hesseltinella vesiculosa]
MQPFLAPKPAASQEPNTIVPSCTTSVSTASLSSCPPTPLPSPGLPERKKRVRSVGRLALDDAIKQVQVHNNPEQAFQGWSEARLRAYRMIDTNPNSYYYRFNAPGEEQAKGPWTELEKQLFLDRLKELGANSQWGVFSMVIPGRVGYQCSNYYRYLIEIGELQDTNYIVDEKGKAHYLFDKKTPFGTVEKTLRTHIKHGSRKREVPKKPKKPTWQDDDTDDGEYNPRHKKKKKKSKRPY